MIGRDLAQSLLSAARESPAIWLTGPRQSGKTTLCRALFADLPYLSLEPLDNRAFARDDPRGLLAEHPNGVVLDEIQRVPELLSYIQEAIDEDPRPGRFVLTGSQQLGLGTAVSQSLAGRVAILYLLPPSWGELGRFGKLRLDLDQVLVSGAYPRIFDRGLAADRWLGNYFATYVQRDVRQALNVTDLESFTLFTRLCAASTGREVNLSRLGADAGISQPTARAWLSVLEATFVCWRLPAWHRTARKRLVRAPKLHFWDTGLVCHLLAIRNFEQLRHHPLRGSIFETWMASELRKQRLHQGLTPDMYHYREVAGREVDLIVHDDDRRLLVEAKAGRTLHPSMFAALRELGDLLRPTAPRGHCVSAVIYGGDHARRRGDVEHVPWQRIEGLGPSGPQAVRPGN